jgi:hypothetical protein
MSETAESLSRFVKENTRDGGLEVACAHQGLGDDNVFDLLQAIESALEKRRAALKKSGGDCSLSCPITLVAEMNFFGDAGVSALVSRARAWAGSTTRAHWQRLRLHMNRVGDAGCSAIGDYISSVGSVAEVHLSHNRVSTAGAVAIIAASTRRYPRPAGSSPKPQMLPLWLRLEHNIIEPEAVRREAVRLGVRWCPGLAADKGTGSRGARGGGRGRGRGRGRGGAARSGGHVCGASFCLQNIVIAQKYGSEAGRGRAAKPFTGPIPYCHVHLCLLDEQRPVSTTGALPLADLFSSTAAARSRASTLPPSSFSSLFDDSPPQIFLEEEEEEEDEDADEEEGIEAGEGKEEKDVEAKAEAEAESEAEVEGGGEAEGEKEEMKDSEETTDKELLSEKVAVRESAPAAADTTAPPPPLPSRANSPVSASPVSPIYVILDTSAVIRMWDRADSSFFTFKHLGVTGAKTGVVWVLLDTVLQQLDAGKRARPDFGAAVNGFMRAYPALEAAGALVRLAAEDVEDSVRSGGANVATRPGCRSPDGRFDSDGVIIDAALVVARALGNTSSAVILLTDDAGMRARARGARLSASLWHQVAANYALLRNPALSADAFLAALPAPDRDALLRSSVIKDAAGPGAAREAAVSTAGRSAALELRSAAELVHDLAAAARALVGLHCSGDKKCAACSLVSVTATSAELGAKTWHALLAERRSVSSLHAAVFADQRKSTASTAIQKDAAKPAAPLKVSDFNFSSDEDEEKRSVAPLVGAMHRVKLDK